MPFFADSPVCVIYHHANAPIPRLPAPLGHVQPLLEVLLAKRPDERPASAAEIVARIVDLIDRAAA